MCIIYDDFCFLLLFDSSPCSIFTLRFPESLFTLSINTTFSQYLHYSLFKRAYPSMPPSFNGEGL